MKKLITSVLMGLVTINVLAQTDPGRPALVVGIVVDQLRTDYVEYLQSCFGEHGFRRLMEKGAYLRDVDFKVDGLDIVSGTAMIYTGAYPARTGVASAYVYDKERHTSSPALSDSKNLGNFSDDTYSADNLRLSTISDELAIDGGGLGAVYSFAANPQQSVIMAGHAGTCGAWINPNNGNWATTTYYKPMPAFLSARNYSNSIRQRIDTMQWKPSMPIDKFPGLPAQKKLYPFRHTFPRSDKDVYLRFSSSPQGNAEVTDVAIECLRNMRLGANGNTTDMLNIGYSLAPYKYVNDGDYRAELTDSYLRLDKDLTRLFEAIDKYVGPGKAVVFLTSTGYYDDAVIDDKKYRIPGGEFSMKRAKSLLNSYLSARHGNAGYVDAFKDGHIYFDHRVLEEKNLDVNDVMVDARAFLAKMSGVADVYTLSDILAPNTPEEERMRLSVDPKRGGDMFVTFNPGWTVTDDIDFPVQSRPVRESAVVTPAFIYGPGIEAETIDTPVDATSIAPTVAGVMRIRSPNGSHSKPLMLK